MENQHREFRIGAMVLAALVSLVFLTVYFGKQSIMSFGDEYRIYVRFQRTPGISKNSPVFKNGVSIGRVSNVQLVDQDREVEITILLPKDRKIYTNEECRVRQTVIMGDASLEFVKKSNYTGPVKEIDPDEPLVGGVSTDIMTGFTNLEGDLTKAIINVSEAAAQFSDVAVRMGDFIDRANMIVGTPEEIKTKQANLEATVGDVRATMQSVRRLSDNTDQFLNDPKMRQDVKKVIESLPELLDRSRNLVTEANQFVKDGRALMERSVASIEKFDGGLDKAERAIDGVTKVTEQVQVDIPEFMGKLKSSATKLDSFLSDLSTIVAGVRESDGTIKRLMRDPELYEKLMATVDNVEQLTGEVDRMLRVDMKPIANNVKILTDKAARDPSIFIRNLIRKQPSTKGALPIWGDGLGSDTLGDLSCSLDAFHRETMFYEFDEPVPDLGIPNLAPEFEGEIDADGDRIVPPNSRSGKTAFGRRVSALLPKSFSTLLSKNPPKIEAAPESPYEPASLSLPTMPEEGRVVHVDPRYQAIDDEKAVYRQMSYETESEETPRLRFTRKD